MTFWQMVKQIEWFPTPRWLWLLGIMIALLCAALPSKRSR